MVKQSSIAGLPATKEIGDVCTQAIAALLAGVLTSRGTSHRVLKSATI